MDKISTLILASSLIIIMLGMGLSLVMDDFKRVLIYPKAVVVGLTNQLIVVPVIGFIIVSIFPLKPEIAIGIMILAACPGGATSNLIANMAKGDIALSVTLTAFSSFITILTIPLIINFSLLYFLGEGQVVQLNVLETILQIMVITIIPVSIGMIIRNYKEDFALRMARPVRIASGIVIILVILGLVVKERDAFISYFEQAGMVALLLNASTMLIAYFSSKMLKIEDKKSISIAIESGIQNGTLAITIAVVLLGNASFGIAPAVYSLIMFFTGALAVYAGIRKSKARGEK